VATRDPGIINPKLWVKLRLICGILHPLKTEGKEVIKAKAHGEVSSL
jgi:hypothetical protein